MIIKNLKKYFTFEVQVRGARLRLRVSLWRVLFAASAKAGAALSRVFQTKVLLWGFEK